MFCLSKPEASGQLQTAGRQRADGAAEKRRTQIPDVAGVVHMVGNVEGIEGNGDSRRDLVFGWGHLEIMRPANIELRISWTVECVASDARGTRIRETGVVVVAAGRQAVRTACI